jgi:hypothetical protein
MRTLYESILSDIDISIDQGTAIADEIVVFEAVRKDYRLKAERRNKLTIVGKTPDGKCLVNYTGDVDVKNKDLTTLENELFQWNEVSGTFTCFKINKLKDLKGSPKNCAGFNCNQCKGLESLEGAPEKMTLGNGLTGNGFYCIECINLKTLKGVPETVWGGFYCGNCTKLTSLEGAPKRIVGDFNCQGTHITSIDHKFEAITGGFNCRNCSYLTSLEGIPDKIYGDFDCSNCKSLKSLKGLPSHVEGSLYLPKIDSLFDEVGREIISKTHVKGDPCVVPIKR